MSFLKSDLRIYEEIGQGGMGRVNRAVDTSDKKELAIKYCTIGTDCPEGVENHNLLQREGCKLDDLNHPNVLKFYGDIRESSNFVGLAFEYMPCGNILSAKARMERNSGRLFPESLRHRWICEIAQAVEYLHSKGIVHKDIKAPNCLLDGKLHAKLGDFGLCRGVLPTKTMPLAATVSHLPPECVSCAEEINKYSTAYDIYGFGITVYEILSDKKLYDGLKDWQIIKYVGDGKRPDTTILTRENPSVIDMMERCWDQSPIERPSAPEVVRVLRNVYNGAMEASAGKEAMECVQFVELKRGEGDGETFSMFTQRVTGVQHDGRAPQVNGQQHAGQVIQRAENVNIGCVSYGTPSVNGPQIQFKHLSYEEAKVQLDLRENNIHLRNENGAVSDDQLRQIGNLLSTDFKHLGRCLLFKDPELEAIEHDNVHAGIVEMNQKMLHQWHERNAECASRKWLATACLSLQRRDLIDILAQG